MNRRLVFGDVIRVDPDNAFVSQPDDRRWMVISFDDRLKWTVLFIGPGVFATMAPQPPTLTHWSTLHGFTLVEP